MSAEFHSYKRFSRAASSYHANADIQHQVAEMLIEQMQAKNPSGRRILDLGCGTGVIAERLKQLYPGAEIDGLDINASMVAEAERRLGNGTGFSWILGDARSYKPDTPYDLIVSSSSLHWMNPIDSTLQNIFGMLAVGGTLQVACMADGTLEELHKLRETIAPGKVKRTKFPSVQSVYSAAREVGYSDIEVSVKPLVLEYASFAEFIRRLRAVGVTLYGVDAESELLSRSEIKRLAAEFPRISRSGQLNQEAQAISVSYHVVFLSAQRPELNRII